MIDTWLIHDTFISRHFKTWNSGKSEIDISTALVTFLKRIIVNNIALQAQWNLPYIDQKKKKRATENLLLWDIKISDLLNNMFKFYCLDSCLCRWNGWEGARTVEEGAALCGCWLLLFIFWLTWHSGGGGNACFLTLGQWCMAWPSKWGTSSLWVRV